MVSVPRKATRFCYDIANDCFRASRETEGSGSRCLEGEMIILPLDSAKLLEYNFDIALVSFGGLTHSDQSFQLYKINQMDLLP